MWIRDTFIVCLECDIFSNRAKIFFDASPPSAVLWMERNNKSFCETDSLRNIARFLLWPESSTAVAETFSRFRSFFLSLSLSWLYSVGARPRCSVARSSARWTEHSLLFGSSSTPSSIQRRYEVSESASLLGFGNGPRKWQKEAGWLWRGWMGVRWEKSLLNYQGNLDLPQYIICGWKRKFRFVSLIHSKDDDANKWRGRQKTGPPPWILISDFLFSFLGLIFCLGEISFFFFSSRIGL